MANYATLQVTGPYSWDTAAMIAAGFVWRHGHWNKEIPTPADEQANNTLARRLADQGRAVNWIFAVKGWVK